ALPHVDLAAHFTTAPLQLLLTRTSCACCEAQLTYAPWLAEPVQSQLRATAARAAATSTASAPCASHLAALDRAERATTDRAIATTKPDILNRMAKPPQGFAPPEADNRGISKPVNALFSL